MKGKGKTEEHTRTKEMDEAFSVTLPIPVRAVDICTELKIAEEQSYYLMNRTPSNRITVQAKIRR